MTPSTRVTTWYLEQNAAGELRPAREPDAAAGVTVVRSAVPSPEFSRYLYTAVGADVSWTDRLDWDRARWLAWVNRPELETWVAHEHGTPAGFIDLAASADGVVEITSFGLLPAFRGRRIGGHLLSVGTARAWDLGRRRPALPVTRRVWLHTCSRDGPHALDNYRRRGFQVFDTRVTQEPEVTHPGLWSNAPAPADGT
jgi:ribosomal protein S18 acetylase RimI-like enzyme